MANANRRRSLGILSLADTHTAEPPPPRGFDSADWFNYPTIIRMVPGAWAREVVAGNSGLADAYAETARELERLGVSAITADCGYSIQYQEAVRNAVSIPVACSSLLQLPLLRSMLPKHGRIGLLCFDADTLTAGHLALAGIDASVPLAIGGIQGTRSWKNWIAAETITEWDVLEQDVMSAAHALHLANPDITHWLLECAGFPRFRPLIKAQTGLPVLDWVTLCDLLMESTVARNVY